MCSFFSADSMASSIFQLLYFSRATAHVEASTLAEILQTSQRNNQRSGISGLLIYEDYHFMQVLEGTKQAVEEIFAKICVDERHTDVFTIYSADVEKRQFGGWAMAHYQFQPDDEELRNSFVEIEKGSREGVSLITGKARKFITTFETLLSIR